MTDRALAALATLRSGRHGGPSRLVVVQTPGGCLAELRRGDTRETVAPAVWEEIRPLLARTSDVLTDERTGEPCFTCGLNRAGARAVARDTDSGATGGL